MVNPKPVPLGAPVDVQKIQDNLLVLAGKLLKVQDDEDRAAAPGSTRAILLNSLREATLKEEFDAIRSALAELGGADADSTLKARNDILRLMAAAVDPLTVQGLQRWDRIGEERARKFMHTGKRFEHMPVEIIGKHPMKGAHGVIVGDHDSAARADRDDEEYLALGEKRISRASQWSTEGILLSIRLDNGTSVMNLPVSQVRHRE